MSLEHEQYNEIVPLKNTAAMKAIAAFLCNGTSLSADLTQYFGPGVLGSHYLTIAADGGKLYVALSTNAATIDETAVGNGVTVAWAVPDGRFMRVRPTAGREVATGIATQVSYGVLNYKGNSGVYVRVYRSSLAETQGAGEFKAP